jgi:hypothetical protein
MWAPILGSDGSDSYTSIDLFIDIFSGISNRIWSRDLWPKRDWIPTTYCPVYAALRYISRSVDSGCLPKCTGQCLRRLEVVDFTTCFVRLPSSSTPLSDGF